MSRFAPEEGKDDLQGLDGKVVVMTGRCFFSDAAGFGSPYP